MKIALKHRISIPRIRISVDIIFYLGFSLYLMMFILSTSFYVQSIPSGLMKLGYYACVGCMLYKELICILLEKYKPEHYFGFLVALILFVICWKIGGPKVGAMFLMIYSIRNMDFKKVAKYCIIFTALLLCFIMASSFAGIIKDYIRIEEERRRHYLGFRYCLYPSTYLFNITALFIYIRKEKIRLLEIVLLFGVNLWMYLMTFSRLTFATAAVLLLASAFLKFHPFDYTRKYRLLYFSNWIFVFLTVFSLVVCWNYDRTNRVFREVNQFLEGRLSLSYTSLHQFGIKLFGSDVKWIGNGLLDNGKQAAGIYLYVDNFYINFLQRYGIVAFTIVLVILTLVMRRFYERKDYYAIMILCLLAVHGLIDDLILHVAYNTFWLLCGEYLFLRKESWNQLLIFLSNLGQSRKRSKKWINQNH